jgi:uncharacterized protein (TIGR00369 family)
MCLNEEKTMSEARTYRDSPLGEHLGFEAAEVDDVHAVQRLTIQPHHTNPTGSIHGGVLVSLADNLATAMAGRANAGGPNAGKFMVAVDLHTVWLRNQQGGAIEAEARVGRAGRRITVIHTVVRGDGGRALAEITTTHVPA